jgi:NSS family neurotransmitter:Na+ symporter
LQTADFHGTWSSRIAFLLAAVGAAVGLGNMWKFPYTGGVSGGGAFVLVYLAAVILVAVPIMIAELAIGRRGRRSPVNSLRRVAEADGANPAWKNVGWVNVGAGFLILTFYSVIAGWAMAYIPKLASGMFTRSDADLVSSEFDALLASPMTLIFWHAVFMALTVFIVARGIQDGIEKAVKFLMPSLFLMLLVLVVYACIAGDFGATLDFMFTFDFSKIDVHVVVAAIGQAFFSVSVAMGLLMTYGAYLPESVPIPRASIIIALADTLVALLAGFAIFPVVFANGLDPAEGPGLVFVTLPLAFGHMPLGALFGTLFFVLLVFAALTSSIALFEPIVSWAEEHKGVKRRSSAFAFGTLAFLIGLLTVFSFNLWGGFHPLDSFEMFAGKTIFDVIDYVASNILLPVGGILIALFAGWGMARSSTLEELGLDDSSSFAIWRFLIRYVSPIAVAVVLATLAGG